MARGYCVDCNYNGPLAPMGDCPRCGSDWTESSSRDFHDEEQLAGLYETKPAKVNESSFELDYLDA